MVGSVNLLKCQPGWQLGFETQYCAQFPPPLVPSLIVIYIPYQVNFRFFSLFFLQFPYLAMPWYAGRKPSRFFLIVIYIPYQVTFRLFVYLFVFQCPYLAMPWYAGRRPSRFFNRHVHSLPG